MKINQLLESRDSLDEGPIGTAIGAGLGALGGGPLGAAAGGLAGNWAGNKLAGVGQKLKGAWSAAKQGYQAGAGGAPAPAVDAAGNPVAPAVDAAGNPVAPAAGGAPAPSGGQTPPAPSGGGQNAFNSAMKAVKTLTPNQKSALAKQLEKEIGGGGQKPPAQTPPAGGQTPPTTPETPAEKPSAGAGAFGNIVNTARVNQPPETTSSGGSLQQTPTGQVHTASPDNLNQPQTAPAAEVPATPAPAAEVPAAPTGRVQGGGRVKGAPLSNTPGAEKKRADRAAKKAAIKTQAEVDADRARLIGDTGGVNEDYRFESKFLGGWI